MPSITKSVRSAAKKITAGLVAAVVIAGFSTCDVLKPGLGEKVDVTPPVLGVDALTADKSIPYLSGTVNLGGAVADDRGLGGVNIQFKAADGSTVNEPAVIANGKWSIAIPSGLLAADPNYGKSLADGEQLITISATDTSGKTISSNQTIYVDNKAPTVLVTSPLTMGSDRPTVTNSIQIMGETYDSSPIADTTVTLLQADGTQLSAPKQAEGTGSWLVVFPLAGATDLTTYYINVKVTDKAGNVNKYYYHRSGIIASKVSITSSFPTIDTIGKLDQYGTPAAELDATQMSNHRLAIDGAGNPTLASYASFIYNANPAMGFSFSNIDRNAMANQNLLAENSVLVGIISPPVGSGAAIDKSTVKAEFRAGSGAWASAAPVLSYTGDPAGDDSDGITLRTLGDSVAFTYKLPSGSFPIGDYQLRLSAATDLDPAIKPDNTVFFMIDSGVPTITETTLDPSNVGSLYQRAPFTLQGVASANSGLAKVEIYEQKDSNASVLVQTVTGLGGVSSAWASGSLPSSAPAAGGSYYNYKIVLTAVGGKTATLYRSTNYDDTPPTVSFANVSPLVGTNTANGNLSVSVSATDSSGINAVRRWIRPAAAGAPAWTNTAAPVGSAINDGYLGEWTSGPFNTVVDTAAAYTPDGAYKLWVVAQDKAGNSSTALSYAVAVDQSTDLPTLSLTNVDVSRTTPAGAVGNLFGSGGTLQGTISDDDMVDTAATRISIDGGAGAAPSSHGGNNLSTSFQHDISGLPEGVHRFNVTAWDLASAKNGKPAVSTILPASGDIYFMIDYNPPSLAVSSPAISGTYQKGNFTISGTASDSNALAGTVQIKDGATLLYTATVSAGAWSQLVNPAALGLSQGSHAWTIVVSDIAGKQTSLPFSFTYDNVAPVVTVANPAAASWNSGTMLTASGGASDSGSVVSVEYSTDSTNGSNGSWASTSGTVNWSVNLDLATLGEGGKTIWVRATDAAGNVSAAVSRAFGVDLNAPTLSETAVNTTATVYRSALYTLSGALGDTNALASIAVTEKKDTNAPAVVISAAKTGTSQTWTTGNLPLGGVANGTYVYTVTATDVAGKTTVLTRTVVIDTAAPTVAVTGPTSGAWLAGSSYLANGTAADVGAAGVALVEYSLSSSAGPWTAAAGTNNWTATISLSPEGAKTLYVRATDYAGNVSGVSSVAFGVDQNPPVLTETAIGAASVTKQASFSFGGGASDTAGLAASHGLTVSVNGGAAVDVPVSAGAWTYAVPVDTLTHANDGNNTYVFTATDLGGHTTTITRSATIDSAAPVVTVTAPIAGQWTASANPTISGVATDGAGTGVAKVYVLVDNAAADHSGDNYLTWTLASGTSSWSATLSLSGEGQKKVWVKAIDTAGNLTAAAATLSFGYDASPPNLTETVNGTSTKNYKSTFSLGGAVSDSNALSSVTVSVNGGAAGAATVGGGAWSYSIAVDGAGHSTDGNLSIVVTATDAAGKTTVLNRAAVVDTKAPTITMINPDPSGSSWLGGTGYTIKGSADDGVGVGVAQVYVKVDAAAVDHAADDYTTWTLATGTSSFSTAINPATLGDGQKKIWVKAVDAIGNVSASAATVLFGVDTVNPVLAFTAPAAGKSFNQAFAITGTATDANLGSVSYAIDGGSSTSLGATAGWSINISAAALSAMAEGSHTVVVSASDAAGNTVTNSLSFAKDSSAPTVAVNTLNASTGYGSTVVQDSTPILTGTLSDNIALAGWNYRIERWTDNADLNGTTWTAGGTMAVVKDWNASPYAIGGTSYSFSLDLNALLGGSLGLPLPDGRYRLLATAVDTSSPANTAATVTREFRLDRGVPTLVLTTPASQGLYMGADFGVAGTAAEANGIQSVQFKFDSSDFTSGTIYTATLGGTPTAATWTGIAPTAAVSNGSHLVWVQATAYSGKTSLQSVSVNIDKTPPTVAITSASNATRVTGQLVVAGTAGDNTVLSKVQYRFGLNASTWYDMPNGALYSWSYTIPDVSAYANATYAKEINPTTKADQPGSNIWLMPFEVRAVDQAGNATALTTGSSESGNRFYFMLDPLGDLPTTDIFSPTDGASLGGEINIYGSATDNTWVKSLSYQVSQDGVAWTDGAGAGSAAGSSAAATIVGNPGPTLSWSAKINSSGWMSPVTGTKTIYFRIHATDSKDYGATAGVNGTDKQISIVLNSSIPQIKNVAVDPDATAGNGNDVAYSSGVKAAGTFYVRADVYTPVGLSDLKRVEQGPLSGQTSILSDSSQVTPPTLKTAGSFVSGRKYLIVSTGSTDFTAVGGVNTVGKTFTATGAGSGSGTAYEADSSGLYQNFFHYAVSMQINSATLGSNQFANTSGVYAFNLTAVDLTTPSPYQTSSPISIQIDNYYPSSNGMLSVANVTGTSFAVQGSVTDVGAGSGTVAGISKVVAYMTRGSLVLNLRGGAASAGASLTVKDNAAGGAIQSVLYPPAESGTQSYSFNVSSYSETPGKDADTANGGNADGFEDKLTYDGSNVSWYAKFDTTAMADGPAVLHYVIFDSAGNASHYTQSVYIANNPPQIVKLTLGTDLNGDGTIGDTLSGESVDYSPAQFAATGFVARGGKLSLTVTASGGNGTKYYSVKYGSTEQNASLTGNVVTITNFAGIPDSAAANDRSFAVFVYDSTVGSTPGVDSLSDTKSISLTVKNTDLVSPTVTMVPLYWTSAGDNSIYGNSAANGHIDFGAMAAPLNDANPKVSGQIKITGTVSDDQRIQYVTMTIGNGTTGYDFGGGTSYGASYVVAQWNSGTKSLQGVDQWAARGWKFVVTNESLTGAGHSATWELDWDSAKLNTVTGTGVSVTVRAQDFQNAGSLGSANLSTVASQSVDVVPYVTAITRDSAYNTNRSKYGYYPLMQAETGLVVDGFNLFKSTTQNASNWIRIYNAATGGGYDANGLTISAAPSTSQFTLNLNANSKSGWLRLAVNGIEATNNMNSASADFDKEDDGSGLANTKWLDDRYLVLWNANQRNNLFDQSASAMYPSMGIDYNGQLFGSWINYATSYLYYATSPATAGNAMGARTNVMSLFDPMEFTDIYVDPASTTANPWIVGTVLNASYGTAYAGMVINAPKQADGSTNSTQANWTNICGVASNGTVLGYRAESLQHNTMLWQFYNVKVARSGNNLHWAYYDDNTKSIKYGYQNASAAYTGGAEIAWFNLDGGSDGDDTASPNNATTSLLGNGTAAGVNRTAAVGQSVSLTLDNNGYPVVAYYDMTNSQIRVVRATAAAPNSTAKWRRQTVFAAGDANRAYTGSDADTVNGNVSIYVDRATGAAYIVGYRTTKGQLIYIGAPSRSSANDATNNGNDYAFGASTVLDSSANVGSWSDITFDGSKPMVVYQNKALLGTNDGMKVAYWDAGKANWDYYVLPSYLPVISSRLNIEYKRGSATWGDAAVGYKSTSGFSLMYLMPKP